MGTNRNTKLRRHQQDCNDFVDAGQPATVDLTIIDRFGLQVLFEHYSVMTMLAGCNADRSDRPSDLCMSENIVRTCRLFYPKRLEFGEVIHPFDRLLDVPNLV